MTLFTLDELHAAAEIVRPVVAPTPTHAWPLLARRSGVEVYVKHENHTPIGAFKARGGAVYMAELKASGGAGHGVVTATRGNHGQSVALAARAAGLSSVIVVPEGNSLEKNRAMEAFGAELVVAGADFDESKHVASEIAEERGLHFVASFHPALVKGVATYALELFFAHDDLAVVYVPIGMGSGIAGLITARDLLGLKTEIVGVVAENAAGVALSFEAGQLVGTNSARTFADGMACRDPHPDAMDIIGRGAARILRLTEDEISDAARALFSDTHNVAEGAGAAAFAGLMQEREQYRGRRAGVILTGGNIDTDMFAEVLAGRTPKV